MFNYRLTINLKKLRNSFIQTIKFGNVERRCICIPISDNDMAEKDEGVYYDALCYFAEQGRFKDRHYIKQYIKDLELLPDELKPQYPIIGQLTVSEECQIPITEPNKSPFELNKVE